MSGIRKHKRETDSCVLSPLLFSIYTNDLRSHHPSVKMLKYADDTTIFGLIRDEDESQYIKEVNWAVEWCRKNKLHLNASKTKEIVVDLRRKPNTKTFVIYLPLLPHLIF